MNEPRVFISYARDDAEWVRSFARALRAQQVNVWLDQDELQPGDSLSDAVESGLRNSDAIVAILPTSGARHPSTFFELGAALGMGKRLIPIVPSDLERSAIPYELRSRRYLTKGVPADAAREVAETLKGRAA